MNCDEIKSSSMTKLNHKLKIVKFNSPKVITNVTNCVAKYKLDAQ